MNINFEVTSKSGSQPHPTTFEKMIVVHLTAEQSQENAGRPHAMQLFVPAAEEASYPLHKRVVVAINEQPVAAQPSAAHKG